MKIYQNRSQLIRTSISGNRKSQLTYNKLPVSHNKIQSYKKQLIRQAQTSQIQKRPIPLITSLHQQLLPQKNTFTKFNQTQASTFNRAKGISHRIMSSSQKFRQTCRSSFFNEQRQQMTDRPATEFKTHRNIQVNRRMNAYSPLQVIKTKMTSQNNSSIMMQRSNSRNFMNYRRQCESQLAKRNTQKTLSRDGSKYLKKGSAFDRSLVLNILKSKFKQGIASGVSNYSNARSNSILYNQVKKQIPYEFRDIIGPQQMLRMSKILTGINLKTVNMNQRIQKTITNKLIKNKIQTIQSNNDDHQTLKSIKRW